jgi:predicted DNA-binding mobile mystery protein A
MTTTQLGRRMAVSQSTATEFENGEVSQTITLETLARAANALECRLVYAFVPRRPLEDIVAERARALATKHLRATSHSMALEGQRVHEQAAQDQLERLVRSLVEKSGSNLWEPE